MGKVITKLGFLVLFVLSSSVFGAGYTESTVARVSVFYGNGCILLDNNEAVKVDLNSEVGKAEFALAISALSTDKRLKIYQNDNALVGGCNTGTTVKPHSAVIILK